jgi:hypothetical protein
MCPGTGSCSFIDSKLKQDVCRCRPMWQTGGNVYGFTFVLENAHKGQVTSDDKTGPEVSGIRTPQAYRHTKMS